jgi:hypothetical protein
LSLRTADRRAADAEPAVLELEAPVASGLPLRINPAICLLFLALLTAAVFWRHLFQGFTFPWDFTATSRWAVFITSTVGSGNFSEWVPFVGGGLPLAECAVCGLYSPLWWAVGALHIPATVGIQTSIQVLHVLIGAWGVFVLARNNRVQAPWALVAATGFVFFGGLYGNASHDVILRGHAYAPWVLWTLTLPPEGGRWRRIAALPLLVWVVATVGYPGQAVAFLLVGAVYLAVQVRLRPGRFREAGRLLLPSAVGSLAVLAAAYLPYLVADRGGELFRPYPPDAQERAIWSLDLVDLFSGVYLNPFAWDRVPATITAWAVGVVTLIGVCCAGRRNLARFAPLTAAGCVAVALAALPAWLPAGRVLASIPFLFPSRLPASDYKAMAAIALLILGATGWQRIAQRHRPGWAPAVAGLALIAGAFLSPQSRSVAPTKLPLLIALVVAGCLLLAYTRRRLPVGAVLGAVLALTVVEGARIVSDMEILPGQKAWSLAADRFPQRELHDRQAVRLRAQLKDPTTTRPARALPLSPDVPGGTAEDSIGYLGTEYRLGDYGGTITMARHRIAEDARLTDLMLRPWTAWVLPCGRTDCTGKTIALPPDLEQMESDRIRTKFYGISSIGYLVDLGEPSLVVENEIPARGWSADRAGIRQVEVAGAMRGWVVPAGRYEFTARYVQPERPIQLLLAGIALASVAATGLLYRRARWSQRSPRM